MHMADALISPAVGGVMWAAAIGAVSYSARKVQRELDDHKVPLMGVLGAFVFAAQMINFTIPGTGSSGHICGALLLAILLGPYAAFLAIATILTIQCLFFADGGLLALGANMINMGFYGCFIGYPLLYKPLAGNNPTQGRIILAAAAASIVGLQLGAFSVVLETLFSGISELPFGTFVLLMQPIHLAIGLVEGLITAALVIFVLKESPEILNKTALGQSLSGIPVKRVFITFLVAAVLTGGALSWFASANPDGLEWSVAGVTGEDELQAPAGIHSLFAEIQEKTAFLPDYNFKQPEKPAAKEAAATSVEPAEKEAAWPAVDGGTSTAGIIGSMLTLALVYCIGKGVQHFAK